jgi:hypothetical protein
MLTLGLCGSYAAGLAWVDLSDHFDKKSSMSPTSPHQPSQEPQASFSALRRVVSPPQSPGTSFEEASMRVQKVMFTSRLRYPKKKYRAID